MIEEFVKTIKMLVKINLQDPSSQILVESFVIYLFSTDGYSRDY